MASYAERPGYESMKASDVRFFWIEGESATEYDIYHWCVDCPWVTIALWYGGRLATSETPPPGAADTALARKILEAHLQGPAWNPGVVGSPTGGTKQERWLCTVCSQSFPRTEPVSWAAESEPCEKCGCGRRMHTEFRMPSDRGCGMTWTEVGFDEEGGMEILEYGLIHCPCDGYAPPPGAQPLTLSEFPVDSLYGPWMKHVTAQLAPDAEHARGLRAAMHSPPYPDLALSVEATQATRIDANRRGDRP
jgi:hypothetical protein